MALYSWLNFKALIIFKLNIIFNLEFTLCLTYSLLMFTFGLYYEAIIQIRVSGKHPPVPILSLSRCLFV